MEMESDFNVVAHSQVFEKLDILEGAGHPFGRHLIRGQARYFLFFQVYRPLGGAVDAGADVKEGGLASAVRANNSKNIPPRDLHVHILNGLQPAKIFAHAIGTQDPAHFAPSPDFFIFMSRPANTLSDAPIKPCGRNHIITMISTP